MMQDTFLALDIGTQSSRAAVVDLDGRVVAAAGESHKLATPRPEWAEQDPDAWWGATVRNIQSVLSRADGRWHVRGVGTCAQMHGTVPVDRHGRLLANAVQLWCDKRAADIVDDVARHLDPAEAMARAGNVPTPAWSGFKMAWMRREQPDLYRRAWKILTPKDYINFRLTGEVATDLSEASGSFLMDPRTHAWSSDLIALLDLDVDKLPAIAASTKVMGYVSSETAGQTGLQAGTPVVVGSGDMLCQLLGIGVTAPGIACDTTGTASIISFSVDAPVGDLRLMNLHGAAPHWIAFGILDSGGGSLRWWRDRFCGEQPASTLSAEGSRYDQLMAEAEAIPVGCEGLMFLPYLQGERTLGSSASRGVFFGLHPRHGRAHGTRAILEGVCLDLRQSLEIVRAGGAEVAEIRTSGGGSRSRLWSQIKADVYGTPVMTVENEEAGILGAAILAAVGVDAFASEGEAAIHLVRSAERFIPQPEASSAYDAHFGVFRELHDGLQTTFRRAAHVAEMVGS